MYAKKGGLGLVKSRRFAPLFATQFLGAFNDNVFKTALFVMIGFYGLGQNGFLPAGQMLNLGACCLFCRISCFPRCRGSWVTNSTRPFWRVGPRCWK
ncbi:hypothetical protein NM97020_1505 [Neisseria meningitidis 97020]|nr:hypothetical protein NM97020_1505 [Neisseria meningitidis 97020]